MLSFVQRYRAIEDHNVPARTSASTHKHTAYMDQLVGLMTELVTQQKVLEDQVATFQQLYAELQKSCGHYPRGRFTTGEVSEEGLVSTVTKHRKIKANKS
jgi:hypothetical protein